MLAAGWWEIRVSNNNNNNNNKNNNKPPQLDDDKPYLVARRHHHLHVVHLAHVVRHRLVLGRTAHLVWQHRHG